MGLSSRFATVACEHGSANRRAGPCINKQEGKDMKKALLVLAGGLATLSLISPAFPQTPTAPAAK